MTGIERAIAAAGGGRKLAAAIGVRPPAVSKWRAQGYVPLHRVERIARMYGVPTWELCAPSVAKLLGCR